MVIQVTIKFWLPWMLSLYSYNIFNLESKDTYLVNFDLSLCFETMSCEWTVPILKDTYLPKQSCDWNRPMVDTGNLKRYKSMIEKDLCLTQVSVSVSDYNCMQDYIHISTPCYKNPLGLWLSGSLEHVHLGIYGLNLQKKRTRCISVTSLQQR